LHLGIFSGTMLTVLNEHIAHVPEDKWHRPSWQCSCFFGIVPRVSISIDATSAVSIDVYPLSSDDEPSVVVLEGNWVGIVTPIV